MALRLAERFRRYRSGHVVPEVTSRRRPGCDVPEHGCEVHHVEDWATIRCTDINALTLACGSDHPLVEPGGWTTRKRNDGTTEWIPPPHLGHGQPRTNTFHHPEKLLRADDDEDEP